MKTITLEKPDGAKFQVNDHRTRKPQLNFQTFKSGYAMTNKKEELLLPAGVQINEDKKPTPQSNDRQKVKPLYPTGVNPKD